MGPPMDITDRARAKGINEAEVEELWQAFGVFDADGNGEISAEELAQVMQALGLAPSVIDLRALIREVDVEGSGTVDFEEFKALMIAQRGDNQSRLKLAFSIFDQDNSDRITAEELKNVMGRFGLSEAELATMIKEVDLDGDGAIGFAEFCQLAQDQATVDQPEASVRAERVDAPASAATIAPSVGSAAQPLHAVSNQQLESSPQTETSPEIERLKALPVSYTHLTLPTKA